MRTEKHKIIAKEPMTIWVSCDKKKSEQPHLLMADKIEFKGNELYFYLNKALIFKVWLKEKEWKKYKNIEEALKRSGINIFNHSLVIRRDFKVS